MRLLCIEDDRVNALLLEQSCLRAGAEALEFAETGAEALEIAAGFAPDLLVIDLNLPDTDGCALLGRLREALGAPDLPAVLYTASPPEQVAEAAARAGFARIWNKPVEPAEVRATLAEFAAPDHPAQ